MVRLVEYQQRYKGQLGPVMLVEEMPRACVHGIHRTGRLACPTCGLDVVQYWCGRGCAVVVDPDHVHGDPTEYATVVCLDGRTERRPR